MTTREALRQRGEAMRARLFGKDAGAPERGDSAPGFRQLMSEAVIQTAPFSGFAPALNALAALSEALG